MRVRLCAVSCATTRPHAPYRFPRTCTCRALASAACCQTSSATNPLSVWSKVDSFERLSRPAGATTEQMNVCEAPEVVRTSRRVGCAHLRSSRRQLAAEGVTCYQLQRAGRHTSVRAHHASGPSLTRCECNLRRVAHRVAGLRGCELLKSVGVSPSSRRRNLTSYPTSTFIQTSLRGSLCRRASGRAGSGSIRHHFSVVLAFALFTTTCSSGEPASDRLPVR